MESAVIQKRPSEDEIIECWDDDDDLQFNDGHQFRTASSSGSITNFSLRPSGHRDSISSRRSARSDIDSNAGDEDWQVLLHYNDELAKEEALASAKHAGIPIPANIPSSALIGGAIKRLSTRKTKRSFVDDWSDDVEIPDPEMVLQLRTPQYSIFPESIRSVATSPVKSTASPPWNDVLSTRIQSALVSLDRFQDENTTPIEQIVPIIKAPPSRSPRKTSLNLPRKTLALRRDVEDFDQDLEFPPDHQPLQLTHRKDYLGISSPTPLDDFDLEWAEGSIGIRLAGTARDGRSVPSSTISLASPSVSSCLTVESEEDGLDGLVFPEGPLDFGASLKKRQESSPGEAPTKRDLGSSPPNFSDVDDFFAGIEVDNGRAFSPGKMSLNPNVKCKTERPSSPSRRSATTLTFTSSLDSTSQNTRIPRLSSSHERTQSTHSNLETVSESGAPLSKFQSSQCRLGHTAQTSVSSLPPTVPVPTSNSPVTTRRILSSRTLRTPPLSADSSSRLQTKRSLPSIRGVQNSQRTTSHSKDSIRRPKTPVERLVADGRALRRPQGALSSAGPLERQSYPSASSNTYRPSRRAGSDSSGDLYMPQNTFSRLSRPSPPESLHLTKPETSGSARTLNRPTKRRNFGDGTELESFDDLPTSVNSESKFVKNPAGRGAPRSVRSRLSVSRITPPTSSPTTTPPSAPKPSHSTPRFARDTNSSRIARESRISSLSSKPRDVTGPLLPFNPNWKGPISRISSNGASVRSRKSKSTSKLPSKPQLIKPLGSSLQESKSVRGMRYNPSAFRWEGNENLVQDFDIATAPKSPKPAPALITNVGTTQNVQTVGGMVFDPHRMCWLRARSIESGKQGGIPPEDEIDVFAGLDDLEDNTTGRGCSGMMDECVPDAEDPSAGDSSDEGPITEEFDVGPEFIRRQRAEEEKWRRKVDKWVGFDRGDRETHWRWAIRDLGADGGMDTM
ncbi:hypothetical protein N7495_000674, partial [Penicillium taxi]|uniref:uncharacterized protein n=1 Tax=Penicillium taxi TaxID=168475 RepID=UPI002544DD34